MPDVDARIDELFDLPPEEFVSARDALTKALRGEGLREDAAAVKALKRPTPAAWALDQLARRHPDDLELLLARGRAAAAAQADALGGGPGGGDELRSALRAHRDALAAVGRRLDEILAGRGGTQHRDDVVRALATASTDPALADVLRAGRLSELPTGSGLDAALALAAAAPPRLRVVPADGAEPAPSRSRRRPVRSAARSVGPDPVPDDVAQDADDDEDGSARVEARARAAADLAAAEVRATAARAAVDRAERACASRAAEVDRLDRELARARAAVATADTERDEAAAAARAAERVLDQARRAVDALDD